MITLLFHFTTYIFKYLENPNRTSQVLFTILKNIFAIYKYKAKLVKSKVI